MVGYSVAAKGYRLCDSTTRLVVEKRDVLFDENHDAVDDDKAAFDLFPEADRIGHDSSETGGDDSSSESSDQFESASESDEKDKNENDEDTKIEEEKDEKDDKKEIRVWPGRPKLIRTGKLGRPKKQYNILGALVSKDVPIPATFKEAMSSPYASEWRDAMQREYDSLLANQTWQIADLPRNQSAIGCKWVFNVKRDKDGQIERFKARLVAKGCSQQYGVNYQETFSPVCRLESVRFIFYY